MGKSDIAPWSMEGTLERSRPSPSRKPEQIRWLENWTVLFCAKDNEEVRFLSSWVNERGGAALRTGRCREMIDFFAAPKDYPCLIMLEIGDGDDLDAVIDRCLELRAASPTSPIILMSQNFGKDELSTLRLEICDASLRMPVLKSAFEDVVLLAIRNNGTYCRRKNVQRPFTTRDILERARPEFASLEQDPFASDRAGWWIGPSLLLGLVFWTTMLLWYFT